MSNSIVTAIVNNPKRVKKIKDAKGLERRKTIRKLIVGEAATQRLPISEDYVVSLVNTVLTTVMEVR